MCSNENFEGTIKPKTADYQTSGSESTTSPPSLERAFSINQKQSASIPSDGIRPFFFTHCYPSNGVSAIETAGARSATGVLQPFEQYRLQLYNYAMVERLRCSQQQQQYHALRQQLGITSPNVVPNVTFSSQHGYSAAAAAAAAALGGPYGPRFALSMSLFHNRAFQPEEPKPQHSYIGLIAMAILSSSEFKLVLSDIYQHILDNYPYFRTRGPGWRNSIRHNLSLNDCFIKAGRSANGKGHYWAIHPANIEDFKKGDFRRRKAQRKVRKHMGLAVDDEGTDSPSPPPLAVTPPTLMSHPSIHSRIAGCLPPAAAALNPGFCSTAWAAVAAANAAAAVASANSLSAKFSSPTPTTAGSTTLTTSRKRQFDVASLLAPDDFHHYQERHHLRKEQEFFSTYSPMRRYEHQFLYEQQLHQHLQQSKYLSLNPYEKPTTDEHIDVEANEDDEDQRQEKHGAAKRTKETTCNQDEIDNESNNNVVDSSHSTYLEQNLLKIAPFKTKLTEMIEENDNSTENKIQQETLQRHIDFPSKEFDPYQTQQNLWHGLIHQWQPGNFISSATGLPSGVGLTDSMKKNQLNNNNSEIREDSSEFTRGNSSNGSQNCHSSLDNRILAKIIDDSMNRSTSTTVVEQLISNTINSNSENYNLFLINKYPNAVQYPNNIDELND